MLNASEPAPNEGEKKRDERTKGRRVQRKQKRKEKFTQEILLQVVS